MMTKIAALALSALLGTTALAGCNEANGTTGAVAQSTAATTVSATVISSDISESDTDTAWDDTATKITLSGSSASVSGSGASAKDSVVTITAKGTYVVSGTLGNGQIVIAATKDEKVHLVLNGVTITNKTGAPIYASQCGKLIVTLAAGTKNTLTDGGTSFQYADTTNEEPNAALFCKDDLTINGTGSLTVNAAFNNGIGTKDDLLIVSGDITINAANHGLRGNDSVTIADGKLTIAAGNDGISANNADDSAQGYILIEGGDFNITTSGGYPGQSIKVNKKQMNGVMGGGFGGRNDNQAAGTQPPTGTAAPAASASTDTTSALETTGGKAFNASGSIAINGGTFQISSYDDAIHSDIAITINGGTFSLETGAMGMQALDITINNGTIDILNSYEGMEGENTLTVNGGKITINASDDGINIGGSTGTFYMVGGDVVITAGADGIDSNGNIVQSGGKVTITVPNMQGGGDGPIDYDGTFTRTGGTMVDVTGNELSTEKMAMDGGRGGAGMPGGPGGTGFPGGTGQ